ncbi:type IVB secretion system protein IcmW [Pseudomonas parafulva]|uniref:type IVB secretion system protein IcmW n=1 Tax=Pseudomonas parafulva TaxID=157782 RepID=UPI0004120D43|nr:hypothetical protein [Pseudomonas parafulva]
MDKFAFFGPVAPTIDQLDLTANGVLGHFAKGPFNTYLVGLLASMDQHDDWAVDHGEDASPERFDIQLLMQEIQALVEHHAGALHQAPRSFAELLAHLTSSRCAYLSRYVAQRNQGFPQALSALLNGDSSQTPELNVFSQRLETFGKARLLSEIFSDERLREISQIMESYADV